MRIQDLALQRARYKHLSDEEWRWFLQQEEGRIRTADKLPAFAGIEDWWYPVRLSCEQCSSELTARYKASILPSDTKDGVCTMADLTGGYGIDTYFLSGNFEHTDYVEQNAELCRIATHNFAVSQKSSVSVHNSTAEEFLASAGRYSLLFLDPARRDSRGGKVFNLADCTPNAAELLPTLTDHLSETGRILLKLSPMLDITRALKELTPAQNILEWDVHVVAVRNEVKEVLLLSRPIPQSGHSSTITAIDPAEPEKAFVFTRKEEAESGSGLTAMTANELAAMLSDSGTIYLYEPGAAILKAGAYKTVAARFGIEKAAANTHLYLSREHIPHFPGRVWRIVQVIKDRRDLPPEWRQANVIARNHPLKAEQLKKHLRLTDGGEKYIIGFRLGDKPVIVLAERITAG